VYKGKTFLAIIPARGGSKRLPRKNILNLHGKPLLAWSIDAGLNSKYIDKVIVTSDNDEILSISRDFGATVINRPAQLASDTATTFDALKHAVNHLPKYDYLVLLQPTSPLRTEKHIDEAIWLLEKKNADAIISVCETSHSPLWTNILPNDKSMNDFLRPEIIGKRSQDLDRYYRVNGAIYVCKMDRFLQEKTLFIKDKIYAYEMSESVSIDIDSHIDFSLASLYINKSSF
jgi:CMP-N,N'-diacetyllegionaminic acid synthase